MGTAYEHYFSKARRKLLKKLKTQWHEMVKFYKENCLCMQISCNNLLRNCIVYTENKIDDKQWIRLRLFG